jgi:hypothetical protein
VARPRCRAEKPALAAVPSSAPSAEASEDDTLPTVDGDGLQGPALPMPARPAAEQRRFDRFDKDRDGRITRELLAPRARISASSMSTATTCSALTNGR